MERELQISKNGGEQEEILVEKEVDMGFFEQYEFMELNEKYFPSGCQRILNCSCDCNKCGSIQVF